MPVSSVADLTVEQFKDLVREVVAQTVAEVLSDPDETLELREDLTMEIQHS